MGIVNKVYSDFSGGEYGLLGGLHAPPNSFTGVNMQLYQNGALGPRAGLKDLAPTGVPTGILRGLGWCSYTAKQIWFCVGSTIYGFNDSGVGSAVFTYTGTLTAQPTYPLQAAVDPAGTYITNFADKSYLINHTSVALTALTGSPGGRAICLQNNRMLIGGVGTGLNSGNRIRFSDLDNYNSWTSTNFVDIGDGWQIRAMYPQRTHILIAKEDGSWWVLYGDIATSPVVRKVYGTGSGSGDPNLAVSAPWAPTDAVMLENGHILFIPNGKDYPAQFSGAITDHQRHLQWLSGAVTSIGGGDLPPSLAMRSLNYNDEVGVVSGIAGAGAANRCLLRHEKAWTYHTFETAIGGWMVMGGGDKPVIATPGSVGVAPKFYAWHTYLNRPGVASGTLESTGDASNTAPAASFTLPEWWGHQGEIAHVRSVFVDFLRYDPNNGQTNHFDLTVTALRQYEGTSTTSSSLSFDEASSSGSDTGVLKRKIFQFGGQGRGNGFQLNFSNIRGIAIQKIVVEIEVSAEETG
jgi:hypothetical protein